MAYNDPKGPMVFGKTNISRTISISHDFWGQGTKTAIGTLRMTVFGWREHKYNDKTLHWTIYHAGIEPLNTGWGSVMVGASTEMYNSNYYLRELLFQFSINGKHLVNGATRYSDKTYKMPYFEHKKGVTGAYPNGYNFYYPPGRSSDENLDRMEPDDNVSNIKKTFTSNLYWGFQVSDHGMNFQDVKNWTQHETVKNGFVLEYPPYRPLGPEPPIPPPNDGNGSGGKDISDGSTQLKASRGYSISRAVNTQNSISWSPDGTTGQYNLKIDNKVTVNGSSSIQSSPYTFNTPDLIGGSYTGKVERYYTDYPDILATSNTLNYLVYSKPTLSGITLSKYTISPRAGTSIRVSLQGSNNRNHTSENNFRTGIWSNIKGKYYINEANTNSYRDLSLDNLKTMFPDTSASNGVVNGTVYTNRRNLGVSGGNPGNGNLVYETGTYSKAITVKYTPDKSIDPNREPNNDPSSSGIRYNKRENNIQGAKLTAGHTWVLPNTYNINEMNGVDVTIQYPKTDDSGVLSGYRIVLISANDGSPHAGERYKEYHFDTTDYTDTFLIPYSDLRRGISGNKIEITPYYTSSSGAKWYGPSVTKAFVDIAWMLNDPVIDCPLTGTTWHNHQYRTLFKLPIDRDTNYNGKNDIEFYYGNGNYRYQEIQISINNVVTDIGNNAYMNAQNSWNSPINIGNAKLTYLRNIIINQSLISTYKVDDYYKIKIRVRKAYGQNPNWDGWSNWSGEITVGRKTVSNINVKRHETIWASEYMNVQNAFNNSTACYAKTASNNQNFVVKESFDRQRGDNINGPHLSPPQNVPLQSVKEYSSEFNDLHQLKNKINSYGSFDTDKNRNPVKLDYQDKLLSTFVPIQEFITAAKDQEGATECDSPSTILKGRNYMKYMCDELNNLV